MTCNRCGGATFRSHHTEVEDIDGATLVTEIFITECVQCSAQIKVILPLLPGQEHISFADP